MRRVCQFASILFFITSFIEAEKIQFTIDPQHILEKNFMGFGVQWEYQGDLPHLYTENPNWMAKWAEMQRRVDYMRPSIFRGMIDCRDYTQFQDGKLTLNFDKKNFKVQQLLLDYAESRKIPVIFGEWWVDPKIRDYLGGYRTHRWQEEVFIPHLKHLLEVRKYSMIQYLNLINEPLGVQESEKKVMEFGTWKQIMLNLDQSLKKHHLRDRYKIVGTDGPGDFTDWIRLAARDRDLNQVLNAYEYHVYAHPKTSEWVAGLDDGRLEQEELGRRRRIVNALDPQGKNKPFFMGEAGIDGRVELVDNQPDRYNFEYGLRMADYAVQSIQAGLAGLIAWDMDDAMHYGGTHGKLNLKGWGMWNSLAGQDDYPESDFEARPWYYSWSMLCRYFPKGSTTFDAHTLIDTSNRRMRVAVCRLPDQKGYSIAIINRASTSMEVNLKSYEAMSAQKMNEYCFTKEMTLDANKELVPAQVLEDIDFEEGHLIKVPAKSFTVLTTMD